MNSHAFVIPFRDRGLDPLREANLAYVFDYLVGLGLGEVHVVSDGLEGAAQFNRSRAYNHAAKLVHADVITYCESDMIVPKAQLAEAISMAAEKPGLVIPYWTYHYLSAFDSTLIRAHKQEPSDCTPESIMDDGRAVGAVNVLSRVSIEAIGRWDETFEGSWYDDRAMACAFEICCRPTRFVSGIGRHLYHLPGWQGDHLSLQDRAATKRNQQRLRLYRQARTPARVRELTSGGKR